MVSSSEMGLMDSELGWTRRMAESSQIIDAPLLARRRRRMDRLEAIGLGAMCVITGLLVGAAAVGLYYLYF